jgi:hypothetical protein
MTTEDKTSMTIKPTHRPRRSRQNRSTRKRGELRLRARIAGARLVHEVTLRRLS